MTFLQPSYLWGLLALAIPIAIHLWSRKKVRTIKVGSTQFIAETKSKQSNSIQLNELVLLALRCLIIGTLVGILAQPQLSKTIEKQEVAYVFEPSLLMTEAGKAKFNTIPQDGRRLLVESFPEWQEDEMITTTTVPNYWQLAQQLEEIAADSIVVFTHAFAKAVRGKRPQVQANINWISVDLETPVSETVAAIAKKDSLELITVNSDADKLAFAKAKIPTTTALFNIAKDSIEIQTDNGLKSVAMYNQKALKVAITYDAATKNERLYLEAALRAIEKYTEIEIEVKVFEVDEVEDFSTSDYLMVLDNRTIANFEKRRLIYQPDEFARKLITEGSTATEYVLTKKLTPQVIVEDQLVAHLLDFLALDSDLEAQEQKLDRRTIAVDQLATRKSTEINPEKKVVIASMADWLWIVLIVLLVGERILARIRKQ